MIRTTKHGSQEVDLSPAGEKKEPDWVQANRKRTGSAVPREDRLGARDRSAIARATTALASNRKDGNRTPKEREFNGYDDDDALTVRRRLNVAWKNSTAN